MRLGWRNPEAMFDSVALKMAMDRSYLTGECYLLSAEPYQSGPYTMVMPKFQALGMGEMTAMERLS
jgi:hypothetical protein